jgi:glycosyltransferase involved in cell wall biosynthesis
MISGDKIKSFHLLKHLGRHHNVTLVSLSHKQLPEQKYISAIEEIGVRVIPIRLSPVAAGLKTALKAPFSQNPLEIDFYYDGRFQKVVDELCAKEKFDIGMAFFHRTAAYIRDKPFKKVLIAEDSRVLYQSRSFESTKRSPAQKFIRWRELRKLLQYEPDIIGKFDLTTFVTKADIEAAREGNPEARYFLLKNGVDIEDFPFKSSHADREGISFWGKLNIWSNEVMAHNILDNILPKIQHELPETSCIIAGAHPKSDLRKKANEKVTIIADPPEISIAGNKAAIMLNPHYYASGIQNKVLQAMALGCCVVTTPTGVQGITARHGIEVMIGKDDDELAAHCLTLLKDTSLREKIARNARTMIEQNYTWERVDADTDMMIGEVLKADF